MKFAIFLLLITISSCFARSKHSFGYPREIERFDDELADVTTEAPPTEADTELPTEAPTEAPTEELHTEELTEAPTEAVTEAPPTEADTEAPTEAPIPQSESAGQTAESAVWFFDGHWNETAIGKLTAGKEVEIVYDGSRLPGRDTRYGQRAWDIFVEYKFSEDGEVHSEKLDGPELMMNMEMMTKSIFIPFGTDKLTVWFKHWGYYSGYSYDSDYGKNYNEDVSEPSKATIVFDRPTWAETVYGDLETGKQFHVYYDTERLNTGGDIYAVAKFNEDSRVYTRLLNNPVAGSNYLTTTFYIPINAEELIMWFYSGDGEDRVYDSDYGQNYEFALED